MSRSSVQRLVGWLHWLEDAALVTVLLGMLGLAVYQIVLRNLMGYSITWIEPLNQVAVLWVALLGSMIGARRDNHIKIDLVAQVLPLGLSRWVKRLVALLSSIALAFVCYHTARLVADERAWGTARVAGFEVWQVQLILPIAFGIMTLRYGLMIFRPVVTPSALPVSDPEALRP